MKISRRTFLKFMAAGAGCAAALLLSPLPWHGAAKLVGHNQTGPVPLPRGKKEKKSGLYSFGQNIVPVEVCIVDGLARKIYAPRQSSSGWRGLTGLAAAAVQNLVRPARLTVPMLRKNGELKPVDWQTAIDALQVGISAAEQAVACVSGEEFSVGAALLRKLLKGVGSKDFLRASDQRSPLLLAARSLGIEGEPAYGIAESTCVLTIGADWLDSWGASYYLRNKVFQGDFSSDYDSTASPGDTEERPYYIYCGPYQNATARFADKWLQIKPGDEEAIILEIGRRLLAAGKLRQRAGAPGDEYFEVFEEVFSRRASEITTVVAECELAAAADRLLAASKPLVVIGSALGLDQSPRLHSLVVCLNLMLGNYGKPGGFYRLPAPALEVAADFNNWLADLLERGSSLPKCLLFHNCNPVYTLAGAYRGSREKLGGLLTAVPFKVALSVFENETTALCDLVLPIQAGLEGWEQVYCPTGPETSGFFSIVSPTVPAPAAVPGVAGIIAALSGKSLEFGASILPEEEFIFKRSCELLKIPFKSAQSANDFLVSQTSGHFRELPPAHLIREVLCDKKNLPNGDFDFKSRSSGLQLVVLACQEHLNFNMGLSSFRSSLLFNKAVCGQEGENSGIAWLHPEEARRLGFKSGDKIVLSVWGKCINAVVGLSEALAQGCVGVYAGFGHSAGDRFSRGYGINVFDLFELVVEQTKAASYYRQPLIKIKHN